MPRTKSQGEGSGEQRFGQALTGSLAEDMVEHQGAHATVHQSGRPLVGRVEGELTPALGAVVVVVDGQRRGDRVAQADHRVAPDDGPPADRVAHHLRFITLSAAQGVRRRLDRGPRGMDGILVGLGADGGVDELAHCVGQRTIQRGEPIMLVGAHHLVR